MASGARRELGRAGVAGVRLSARTPECLGEATGASAEHRRVVWWISIEC
jgi:hypothetical protein